MKTLSYVTNNQNEWLRIPVFFTCLIFTHLRYLESPNQENHMKKVSLQVELRTCHRKANQPQLPE